MARRTCLGCRQEADRDELVRLVALPDGTLGIDPKGSLPGRGAWVHPQRECATQAARGLSRALGVTAPPDALLDLLRRAAERALPDGVSMAAAAGAVVGGHDALVRAIQAGEVVEVLVASDAAERTVRGLRAAAGPELPFTSVPLDAATLGARTGRGARAALGVRPSRAANHLRRQLRRLRDLG